MTTFIFTYGMQTIELEIDGIDMIDCLTQAFHQANDTFDIWGRAGAWELTGHYNYEWH